MSSKILITVLTVVIVGPFTYIATTDALHIKHNLHRQHEYIKALKAESTHLDTKLLKTKKIKQQTQARVDQLERQTKDAVLERQKLEAKLEAN